MEDAIAACYTEEASAPSFLELQMSSDFLPFLQDAFQGAVKEIAKRFPWMQPMQDTWRLLLMLVLVGIFCRFQNGETDVRHPAASIDSSK